MARPMADLDIADRSAVLPDRGDKVLPELGDVLIVGLMQLGLLVEDILSIPCNAP